MVNGYDIKYCAGFFPPTSGTAVVNGYDIGRDIDSVRQSLGLCPQHNVLFDELTVEEHLVFFTRVRSATKLPYAGLRLGIGLPNFRSYWSFGLDYQTCD